MADKYAVDALRASDPNVRASLLELSNQALKLAEEAAVQPKEGRTSEG